MLKYVFENIPEQLNLPFQFESNNGVVIYDQNEEIIKYLNTDLMDIINKFEMSIHFMTKILNPAVNFRLLDFKGGFGAHNLYKYNRIKVYSERFLLNNELFYFDVANYNCDFVENNNLFVKSLNSDFVYFSGGGKYIFLINFLDVYYGVIFIGFDNLFFNYENVEEKIFDNFFANYSGHIAGLNYYNEYLALNSDQKIILRNNCECTTPK